ncbi:MAG: HipA domain-containing protein [Cyclobacteriaceae bacterium]
MNTDRCPSTLKPGFNTYSPAAIRKLFDGRKVSHLLPFLPPEKDANTNEAFMENRKRLNFSGVKKKLSLRLEKNKLRLTQEGEFGHYILKPIPDDIKQPHQVPANEHLSMQLAEQVFKINTAANAMIFFQDGQGAYLTRRFDYAPPVEGDDTRKYGMEDFATLAQKSKDTHGVDFKYEGSYEDLFLLLKQYVGPYLIEAQKLFRLMLFNYVISNGDAHLKNYSLLETSGRDYILSPAYDLLTTRLHVNDPDIALKDGLFNSYETESFNANGFYAYDDFFQLGVRVGLGEGVVRNTINQFQTKEAEVKELVARSFLSEELKKEYYDHFLNKISRLNYSFSKHI